MSGFGNYYCDNGCSSVKLMQLNVLTVCDQCHKQAHKVPVDFDTLYLFDGDFTLTTLYNAITIKAYLGDNFSNISLLTKIAQDRLDSLMPGPGAITAFAGVNIQRFSEPSKQGLIACECGKEKHGFASHSNWCAKANKA